MNLRDRKLGWLFAILIFFGCEDEIGQLNVNPENNLGIFFEEIPLEDKIYQVWAGSTPSSFSGIGMSGTYMDSVFGKIDARNFGSFSIRVATYDFNTLPSAEADSLFLEMRMTSATGNFENGDLQQFDLYRLRNPILDGDVLSSSTDLVFENKIAEAQVELNIDSLNLIDLDQIENQNYDQSGRYIYTLKFNFETAFLDEFTEGFVNAVVDGTVDPNDSQDVDSIGYYLDQYLKGFALIPSEDNNAIISFNYFDTENYDFQLNYRTTNNDGSIEERTASFLINPFKSFNYISPNENNTWDGGVFDEQNDINLPFKIDNSYAYQQSGTNMFITINLSDLNNIQRSGNNIIIQRAELLLNNVSDLNSFIPQNLSFTITNLNGIQGGIYSQSLDRTILNDLPSSSVYESDSNRYEIAPTLYLQGIFNSEIPYNQIIVGAVSDNNFNSFAVKKEDISLRYYYTINQ